jgi:hypothetical protein
VNVHVGNTRSQPVRDFPSRFKLACWSFEVMRERGDIGLLKLSERGRSLAVRCIYRATHQGIGILRKDLVVIEIVVVEKEEIRRHAIFALNVTTFTTAPPARPSSAP